MTTTLHYQALLLIAALLPTYLVRFSVFGLPTNLLEALIILVAILGVISPTVRRSWRRVPARLPLAFSLFIGLFLLSAGFATIISPHLTTSLGILKSWIIIPLLYASMVAASPTSTLKYLHHVLYSGVIIALYSLSDLGHLSRLQAFYDTPNSLALFLSPLIPLATLLAINATYPMVHRRLYAAAAVMLSLALIGTESIGAFLAIIISVALIFSLQRRTINWVFLLLVLLITLLFAPKITYLITPNSSAYVRLQLWSISVDLIKKHPLTGLGLGTFEPAYQEQLHQRFQLYESCLRSAPNCKAPLPEFVFRDPHNWLLSFYLNLGPFGLIAFLGLNYVAIARGIKAPPNSLRFILVAALLTILLHGLVDTIYWKNDLALIWWLLIVIIVKGERKALLKPAL